MLVCSKQKLTVSITIEAGHLGRFSFVRSAWSDQLVLKWNARVLRTGSGQNDPAHGSEPLSSTARVCQSAGIWRVVAGKMYARALDLSI